MKRLIFILFLTFHSLFIFSQKNLTLYDAVLNYKLRPSRIYSCDFIPKTKLFAYVQNYKQLLIKDFSNKTIETINVEEFNDSDLNYLYIDEWLDDKTFLQIIENKVFIIDYLQKKVVKKFLLPQNASNIFYNNNAKAIAYTLENNIFLMTEKGESFAITNDTNKSIVNGSDYVHRQEFGIDKGIFWSPMGNKIAFYRKDETMVADYPLIDFTTIPAKVKMIKYPMAGQTSEEVTLGIYDLKTQKTIFIQTGTPKDQYLTSITWDPSEKYIYIGILNRDQNHLKFNKYDVNTGKLVKTIFEEKHPKYVEPLHPAIFLPLSKNKFIWQSQRDGFNHIYLYDTSGTLINQLTKGNFVVTEFLGFSYDEKYLFFQSTEPSPLERHIYALELATKKITKLTEKSGTHVAKISKDGTYIIDLFTSIYTPYQVNLIHVQSKKYITIYESENPLKEYTLPSVKYGTIKAADGKTELHYRLILPPNLDTTKKYPVIIYVYGGPHAQLVLNEWTNGGLWNYYMAQKGYIIFTLDNRGSANRGIEFENVTFRQLGIEEMKDQIEGLKFLKKLRYVDSTRIGVHGWSFGGFMTISLLTTYPNLFKVGVAGGPVIDWKLYEVMYGERYMDTPQDNPEGYTKTSILNKIKNLKAKLLVIHGFIDPVVVPQHTQLLLLEAEKNNIQIDFYLYPTEEHNVKGKLRLHLMEKITNYFDQNL